MGDSYKKSSFCILGGCIEIAIKKHGISIRNSNDHKKVIRFSKKEWRDFLKGVKGGEFDV